MMMGTLYRRASLRRSGHATVHFAAILKQFLACTGDDVVDILRSEAVLRRKKRSGSTLVPSDKTRLADDDKQVDEGKLKRAFPTVHSVPLANPKHHAARYSEAHPHQVTQY